MKTYIITALFTLSCLGAQAAVYTASGPIVNPANGHTYYLLGPGTWTESEAYAQTLGGHLATINDAAENAWVFANVNSGPTMIPWIGLNDSNADGIWTWSSGEPVTYLNWAPGEPNFLPEFPHYFVNIYAQNTAYAGQWNNSPDSDVLYGIAEVVPEPSALAMVVLGAVGYIARKRRSA
jgi:hypothetical protein